MARKTTAEAAPSGEPQAPSALSDQANASAAAAGEAGATAPAAPNGDPQAQHEPPASPREAPAVGALGSEGTATNESAIVPAPAEPAAPATGLDTRQQIKALVLHDSIYGKCGEVREFDAEHVPALKGAGYIVLLSQMMADTSQPVGTPARVEIDPGAGDYTMTEGGWEPSDVQPASREAVDVIDGKAGRATGEAYASRNAVAYPYRRRDRQDPVWQRVTRSGRVVAFADADGGYQSLMPRGQVGRRAVSYPYRSRTNKTSYTLVDRSGRVVVGAPAVVVPTVPVPLSYGQVHVSCEPVNRTFRMVWQHGPNQMMRVDLQPNGFNGLFNFRGAYIAPFGEIGTAEWQTVVVTGSDMFPPMIIQAVNNGDGGGLIYTGGNHGSNGAAGGEQTARMTEFSAWIGGRRLLGTEDPFEVYVDSWRARWINELMAYNTILEPRYVCRQVFDSAFHAGGFSYFNGTSGLEAFYVRADNGPQLFQNGYETVHYYDGAEQARTTIAASTTPGASVQYPSWAMVFAGSLAGLHGTWMDRTFEAGDGRYVRGSAGFYRNGNNGKSYSAVAAGGGEPYRKQGHTPEAVITHAIGKSWQGLEAAKALMPFTHGKIAEQGKKGAKQEAANKAATGGRPVGRCQFGQCSVLPRIASSAVE